ncbi:MAG TPA: FecR family protein, partial [Terriglobales bacterium]|nr:FecR family protein [Terriglobales bacterium]
ESLRTGDGGEAEVELECGSAVRLAPNSRLLFSRLRRRDDGVATTTVVLERGRFFLSVRHADARDFQLELPGARVDRLKGVARLQVRIQDAQAGSIEVTAGAAEVRVGATVYELKKSHRLVWTAAGSVRQLPLRTDTDAWAEWSRNRDREFDRDLIASRPRAQVADAPVQGLPAPGSTLGAPANAFSAWPMLSAGAAAALPEPAPRLSRHAAVPVCARY